jgi:K+-sensing histidine kinase KdpD
MTSLTPMTSVPPAPPVPAATPVMSARWSRDRIAVLAALLAPPAVAAALIPFRSGALPGADAALVLVVVVVAVAATGHRAAGVICAVSSALWFDFFLTQPYERFSISSRDNIETTVLLLVVGVLVTELACWGRRQRRVVVSGSAQVAGVESTAELIASGGDRDAVLDRVSTQLGELLALRGCRFEPDAGAGDHPPVLQPDGTLRWGATLWDVDRLGLPEDEIALPARFQGRTLGRFMLLPTPRTAPSVAARRVSVVLADLVGAMFAAQGGGDGGGAEPGCGGR